MRVGDYLRLLGVESRSHGIVGSIPTALVDGGRVAVGEVAARRALGWAEYLRSHAGGSMPRARSWLRTVLASLLSVATRCVPPKEWRMTAQSELTKLTKPTFEEVLSVSSVSSGAVSEYFEAIERRKLKPLMPPTATLYTPVFGL